MLHDGHVHILLCQRRRLPLLPRLLPPLPALATLRIQAAAPAAAGAGGSCFNRQLRLPLLIEKSLDVCKETSEEARCRAVRDRVAPMDRRCSQKPKQQAPK